MIEVICVLLVIMVHIVGILVCVYMYKAIKEMRTTVSTDTHRLQTILHLSVVIEFTLCVITMSFPIMISAFMVIFSIPYGSHVVCITLILMSFQTIFSASAQCYFIRPFKKCAQQMIFFLLKKLCKKNPNIVVATKFLEAPQDNRLKTTALTLRS